MQSEALPGAPSALGPGPAEKPAPGPAEKQRRGPKTENRVPSNAISSPNFEFAESDADEGSQAAEVLRRRGVHTVTRLRPAFFDT